MKRCNKECVAICDFCRFYNFNPSLGGCYTGKGYCILKEQPREPEDECKDFICFNYKALSYHANSREITFLDKKYEKACIRKMVKRRRKTK